MKARWLLLLSLMLLLQSTGCGSGGGRGQIALCDLDSFTPNYAREVTRLFNWDSFPLTVHFVRDAEYSATRRAIALAGFDQWVNASGGRLTYTEVASAAGADIEVRFDPTNDDGATTSHFTGLEITRAEIAIGVKDQLVTDFQCVSAHEFGHALGIDGHSPDEDDLMYAVHFTGRVCPVTTRDLNTVKTGYCYLYGRAAHAESRSRAGSTGRLKRVCDF